MVEDQMSGTRSLGHTYSSRALGNLREYGTKAGNCSCWSKVSLVSEIKRENMLPVHLVGCWFQTLSCNMLQWWIGCVEVENNSWESCDSLREVPQGAETGLSAGWGDHIPTFISQRQRDTRREVYVLLCTNRMWTILHSPIQLDHNSSAPLYSYCVSERLPSFPRSRDPQQ